MAQTSYDKTISTGTLNGKANGAKLGYEIGVSSIVTALERVDVVVATDTVHCVFKDALSAGDQTTLTSVVSAHDGEVMADETATLVQVAEEEIGNGTGGRFRTQSIAFTCNANSSTNHDFSFPYDISLLSADVQTADLTSGDVIEFTIAPGTTIGGITADVNANNTTIDVQSTVTANSYPGLYVTLNDLTNTDQAIVTSVDVTAGTITLDTGPTNSYAAVTPTYVQMDVYMSPGVELVGNSRYVFGESKIGGSLIPANTTIRIGYTNTSGSAVTVAPVFEFLY